MALKEVRPLYAGRYKNSLIACCKIRRNRTEEKHWHIKLVLGYVPTNIYVDFSPAYESHTHTQKVHSSHSSTAFWGQFSNTIYSFQMNYEENSNADTWQHSFKRETYSSQNVWN